MTHGKGDAPERSARTSGSPGTSPVPAESEELAQRSPAGALDESAPTEGGLLWKEERLHFHSGPLPAPKTLAGYQALLPGAADRVFTMAEKDLDHQHATETTEWGDHVRLTSRGQWMAFSVAILALLGGMLLVYLDKSVAGLATMILPIATIIGLFVTSKRFRPDASQPDPDRRHPVRQEPTSHS